MLLGEHQVGQSLLVHFLFWVKRLINRLRDVLVLVQSWFQHWSVWDHRRVVSPIKSQFWSWFHGSKSRRVLLNELRVLVKHRWVVWVALVFKVYRICSVGVKFQLKVVHVDKVFLEFCRLPVRRLFQNIHRALRNLNRLFIQDRLRDHANFGLVHLLDYFVFLRDLLARRVVKECLLLASLVVSRLNRLEPIRRMMNLSP